eukprot:1839752-Pleurochrysis_carterae.AAC.2
MLNRIGQREQDACVRIHSFRLVVHSALANKPKETPILDKAARSQLGEWAKAKTRCDGNRDQAFPQDARDSAAASSSHHVADEGGERVDLVAHEEEELAKDGGRAEARDHHRPVAQARRLLHADAATRDLEKRVARRVLTHHRLAAVVPGDANARARAGRKARAL